MHGSAENQLARGCNGWRRGYLSGALLDVINFINTGNSVEPLKVDGNMLLSSAQHSLVDFKDARAIHAEARALEVACAGGHNILMIRTSRAGKNDAGEAHSHYSAPTHV